ncbi:MAG: hypothetical protein OEW08_09965 [Gammaproteobacteria bacterium]|nr:hypothetical protein [Gammaproteobacteria bacterium]
MKTQVNLERAERLLVTDAGKWYAGDRVIFRGADLHRDLADMDWMSLYLFAITGRRFTAGQMRVLQAIWTGTSYPDPRIWNNRVVALAATARSTSTLALGAATAVSEARIYGHQANTHAIDFIQRARHAVDQGESLEAYIKKELDARRMIGGYGRPLYRTDERIPFMSSLLKEVGMFDGPHVQLAFRVEHILLHGRWRYHMNISGLDAAIGADLGFSMDEYVFFMGLCFTAGMAPIYLENKQRPAGEVFPLRCTRIEYSGPAPRHWD